MISKILVTTDGSKQARKAIEYAARFAKQTGATVTLISVIDKSSFVPLSIPVTASAKLTEPIENYLKRAAESYIEEAEKIFRTGGVPVRKVIRSGHPVEEIIKEAEKSKVDLIIIGSRGKSALKAAVLGSVTFGIINKESKVPVLVVRR